jgi:hypothetical protein
MNKLAENSQRPTQTKMGVLTVEKRKHPRFSAELPLDYARVNGKETYGGIVANASEGGLLAYLPEKIDVGAFLKIEIFFAKGLEFNTIKAVARIAWYDLAARESWGEHRYGLQFQQIEKEDFERLKTLLKEIGK